jgi:hypothetical protein
MKRNYGSLTLAIDRPNSILKMPKASAAIPRLSRNGDEGAYSHENEPTSN